jgi:hypothetical protein
LIRYLSAMILVGATSLPAADWPGLHGGATRSATSTETGLARTWPEGGPPLVWSTNGLGQGFASVAVAGDVIVTAGEREAVDKGERRHLTALNLKTGTTLWSVPWHHCGSTPFVQADRVYNQGGGVVSCHALADGKLLWQFDLRPIQQAPRPKPPFKVEFERWYNSPLVHGGRVYVVTDHPQAFVVALDAATGKEVWRANGPETVLGMGASSPALVRRGNRDLLLVPADLHLYGVDAADGKVLWQATMGVKTERSPVKAPCNDPLYHNGLVTLVNGYDGTTKTFRLNEDGSQVSEVWTRKGPASYQESAVVCKGLLFGMGQLTGADAEQNPDLRINGLSLAEAKQRKLVGPDARQITDSGMICLDAATGAVRGIRTDVKAPKQGGYSGPMTIAADGLLFVQWSEYPVCVRLVQPDADMTVLGTLTVPAPEKLPPKAYRNFTAPALSQGRLIVREHDNIWCYDVRKQSQ